MSFASWNGPGSIETIPNNTAFTTVNQNGQSYLTTINVVPEVISRNFVLSTMVDEVITTFFTASNVPPGLYKAGMFYSVGTGTADPFQPRDYFDFFVASQDYLNLPNDSNASQFYRTRRSTVNPFAEGFDPIVTGAGTVNGQHTGFLNVSSIQNVSFCSFMEDFGDNPATHSVFIADPYLQKIG
jgi:hypothetical protein